MDTRAAPRIVIDPVPPSNNEIPSMSNHGEAKFLPEYSGLQPPQNPNTQENGGLAGGGGYAGGSEDPKHLRRLRAQIRLLIKNYPNVDYSATSKLNETLQDLSEEELEEILENIKDQIGGLSPYATTQSILGMVGSFVETRLKVSDYAKRITSDLDLISSVDELMPGRLQDYGAFFQIAWRLLLNLTGPPEITENETNKRKATEEPCSKKATKRARKEFDPSGIPRTQTTGNSKSTVTDFRTPLPPSDSGSISDGEDNMGSESSCDSSIESDGPTDHSLPVLSNAGRV